MDFFNRLFGTSISPLASFFLVFLCALLMFGLVIGLYSLLRGRGMSIGGGRGRQPRLAVLDYADVDNRRRLVLIRRDNVEHLILIGGATEFVVEQNIVRGVPVANLREPAILREAMVELPQPVDLNPAADAADERLSQRDQARKAAGVLRPQPAKRPQPDPFLDPPASMAPPAMDMRVAEERPSQPSPLPPFLNGTRAEPPRAEPPRSAPAPSSQHVTSPLNMGAPLKAEPVPPAQHSPPVAPPSPAKPMGESLAARLEQAMRRPVSLGRQEPKIETPSATQPPKPPASIQIEDVRPGPLAFTPEADAALRAPPPPARPAMPAPASAASARPAEPAKPAPLTQQEKMVFDSLEEEMASLLGRAPKRAD